MAINFRAGLDEIERSGQIAGQGFAQLTQLAQQRGNIVSQGITQRKAMEAQNQQARRQENQQMFEAVTGAATTFANVKMKADEAARNAKKDGMAEEEFAIRKTQFNQAQAAQKAQNIALVDSNAAAIKEGKGFVIPEGITGADEQANYIKTKMALSDDAIKKEHDAKAEARAEKESNHRIANADAQLGISQAALKLNQQKAEQDAIMVASKDAETRALDFGTKVKKITQKDGVYSNYDEKTLKNQEESFKKVGEGITKANGFTQIRNDLFRVSGVTPKSAIPSDEDFRAVAQKIKGLPDDSAEKAQLKQLYGMLLFSAKQPGMGQISESEYTLMGGASGANALSYLSTLGDPGMNLLKKFSAMAESNLVREGSMIGLGRRLNTEEERAKMEVANQISGAGGLYAIDKDRRSAQLFNMLPESTRMAKPEEGGINPTLFAAMPYEKQLSLIYGDKAKGIGIKEAAYNDYLNSNPQEAVRALALKEQQWSPTESPLLPKKSREQIAERHKNFIAAYTSPVRETTAAAANGVPPKREEAGLYPVQGNDDGTTSVMIDLNGAPLFAANPLGRKQSMAQDPYRGVAMTGGGAPAPSKKPTVNRNAWGKK